MVEEGVIGKFGMGNIVGKFADQFFEFPLVMAGHVENLADEKKMEKFFLDFGVH